MTDIHWMLYNAGANSPGFSPCNEKDFFSTFEREHLAQMRFALRRNSFILGRQAAKRLLKRCCSELERVSPDRISIENDPCGAPFARVDSNRLPGCLSISHSGSRALCGYTSDPVGIGIDLEEIQLRSKNFLLDYFTPEEISEVESLPPERQPMLVTAAWSAKEAVLKALRMGLRVDTRQVVVCFPEMGLFTEAASAWMPFIVHKAPKPEYHWQGWWRVNGNQVFTLAQATMGKTERTRVIEETPA